MSDAIEPFLPDSAEVARIVASPNLEARRDGARPSLLVFHYTGMASAEKAIAWLANPISKVSCHYVIDEAGAITQMVPERMRAWHAGVSCWAGECDVNSHSIGIEIQNPGHEDGYGDFPRVQMAAVARLARDICRRNAIGPERVLAHSDVAPARKIDPGEKFDWGWLAGEGVGHWVAPEPIRAGDAGATLESDMRRAGELLADYGYCAGPAPTPVATPVLIKAFQRHFRPARVDGVLDPSTFATLERLVRAMPSRRIV